MSKSRTIICVDPTQAKFDQWTDIKRAMKPDFDNVKQLVQAKPTIIGNCHLLVEYPLTDYVTYDFLAIYDLQPKSLVLLTTSTGHSGGLLLHMWLNNNDRGERPRPRDDSVEQPRRGRRRRRDASTACR